MSCQERRGLRSPKNQKSLKERTLQASTLPLYIREQSPLAKKVYNTCRTNVPLRPPPSPLNFPDTLRCTSLPCHVTSPHFQHPSQASTLATWPSPFPRPTRSLPLPPDVLQLPGCAQIDSLLCTHRLLPLMQRDLFPFSLSQERLYHVLLKKR